MITDLQAAARTLGRQLVVVNARTDSDLQTAFTTFSRQRVGAVLVLGSTFYNRHMEQLVALAARHALAAMYSYREYPLVGGLMSYGISIGYTFHQVGVDSYYRVGVYAGLILKGAKPADLPVQQSIKFVFAINLQTARALGLTMKRCSPPPTR
jgi:putative ABC transport system substrate-binding protein